MRRPSARRLLVGVFLGLSAANAAFILWQISVRGASIPEFKLIGAFGVLLLMQWIVLVPLTVLVVRIARSLIALDAVVGATLAFAGFALLATVIESYARPIDTVTGEPCGDNGERKVATSVSTTRLGARVINWDCVSREEFAARGLEGKRIDFSACEIMGGDRGQGPIMSVCIPRAVLISDDPRSISVAGRFAQHHGMLYSVPLGVIAGTVGWLVAFGWRWRVRADSL